MEYEEYEDYELESYGEEETNLIDSSPFDSRTTVESVYEQCMEPTVLSAVDQVIWLLFACLIFRICTQLVSLPPAICHLISFVSGVGSLFTVVGPTAMYTSILAIATYWSLIACAKKSFSTHTYQIVAGGMLAYLVAREYCDILPESWQQVRGVQMIMVMKTLSLSYEVSNGNRKELPPLLDYLGYMFCPGTVVFGPWISFYAYSRVFEGRRWGLGWVLKVFATSTISVLCLGFSSCWVYWIFAGVQMRWFIAIRDALSVRFSHYFVCFLSEVTCTLCGFYSDEGVTIEVTNPMKIEIPRSLVEVVVHWNISMHRWLRHHVFRPAKQYGAFNSVIVTFLVSSMLHGMNFNLTMVLLSLGLYTYVEYNLREKLASIFDACVRSRSCPTSCSHIYKSSNVAVMLVNILFGFWAYFHLAYLGIMMDKSEDEDKEPVNNGIFNLISFGLRRWSDLGYASHWATLIVFVAYKAI